MAIELKWKSKARWVLGPISGGPSVAEGLESAK